MTEPRWLRVLVAGACGYEICALVTGKVPTISSVCRKHHWCEILLISALVIHFRLRRLEVLASE